MDRRSVAGAGNLFHASEATEDSHPHACVDGLVYIGHVVEEDGEEVERFEALPCRRCAEAKEDQHA